MKRGMAKKVFTHIDSGKKCAKNQRCRPNAVFEAAQNEFAILTGRHKKTRIPNLQLIDDCELDFLARVITRAFISNGFLYGRSQGFHVDSITLPSSSNQLGN